MSLTRPDHHQPHSPPAQLLQLSPAPSNSITSNISTRPPSSFDYNSFRNQPQMSPQYPPPAVRGKRGLAGPREQQQMQPPSQVYYHTQNIGFSLIPSKACTFEGNLPYCPRVWICICSKWLSRLVLGLVLEGDSIFAWNYSPATSEERLKSGSTSPTTDTSSLEEGLTSGMVLCG